ncbi:hypothetical protein FRUB_08303 [Fimbriiglobus ruber]|uniref:Uncharacterized protein n=1 Tax=Fimbriiglobus ruber TaxID=1908690 RepID=A0A225D2B3_9BACT|nr:hypothetical protein FRUB_08303 [Fimbriiglobus ruber]
MLDELGHDQHGQEADARLWDQVGGDGGAANSGGRVACSHARQTYDGLAITRTKGISKV